MAQSKKSKELQETDIEGLGVVRAGQKVIHPKFGSGVIEGLFIFPDGTKTVRVDFEGVHGSKALHPKYAMLKRADDLVSGDHTKDAMTRTQAPGEVLFALGSLALDLLVAVIRSVLMRDWSQPSAAIIPVAILAVICLAWFYGLWRRLNWLRWTTIVLGALGCFGARWSLAMLHDPMQIDLYWVQFVTTLLTVVLLLLPASRDWYGKHIV